MEFEPRELRMGGWEMREPVVTTAVCRSGDINVSLSQTAANGHATDWTTIAFAILLTRLKPHHSHTLSTFLKSRAKASARPQPLPVVPVWSLCRCRCVRSCSYGQG